MDLAVEGPFRVSFRLGNGVCGVQEGWLVVSVDQTVELRSVGEKLWGGLAGYKLDVKHVSLLGYCVVGFRGHSCSGFGIWKAGGLMCSWNSWVQFILSSDGRAVKWRTVFVFLPFWPFAHGGSCFWYALTYFALRLQLGCLRVECNCLRCGSMFYCWIYALSGMRVCL